MKTNLKKLLLISAALTAVVLCTTCKQFLDDPEEYFKYWSTEALDTGFDIDKPIKTIGGVPCVTSAEDVRVTVKLRNPKNIRLVMPAASSDAKKIILFPGLSTQPVYGTDYTLKQTATDKLELMYKSVLLKRHEWGKDSIGAEITLIAEDGRKFKKKFNFNLKVNTVPPTAVFKLVKTRSNPSYYVLCLTVPDMDKKAADGLVHKDLTHIEVNGTPYTFSVNEAEKRFNKPEGEAFVTLSDVEKLTEPDADEVPSGGWVLYYKTDAEVKDGAEKKDYTVNLFDAEGLVSEPLSASTKPNKAEAEDIRITKGTKIRGSGSVSDPFIIGSDRAGAELSISSATPNTTVHCTVSEIGSSAPVRYDGNPVTVPLGLKGAGEKNYKLEYYTDGTGFAASAVKTVYYKVLEGHTVTFNSNGGSYTDGTTEHKVHVLHNTAAAAPAPPPSRMGYIFGGWYKDQACTAGQEWNFAMNTVTSNITLYARWTANTYAVTFSVEGGRGGSLKGACGTQEEIASGSTSKTLTVPHGGSVNFTAQPDTGYEVESWTVSVGSFASGGTIGAAAATLANITQATTVSVTFKKIELPVLKIKQNFSSDEEKNISAAVKGYVSEDIIPDASQYTETNPLVIYNINGKARLSLTAPSGAAASYTLDDGQSSNTAEIMLTTAKKYKLEVWTQKSGLQSDKAVLYVEIKNGLGSYTELQNTVKNAPVVTGGITITINTNALDCSAEPSEIAVTGGKKLIIQSSVSGQVRTINANQKERIFKISGAGTELTLNDIKLIGSTASRGGAVYLENGSLIMKGASYIADGTNGKNDVYLVDGTTITVDGNLTLPAEANGIAALISTNETNAASGYTAAGTKQVLSLINGAAQADCSLFKLARATGASVTGEAASGYLSTKYGIQFESGSPAKGVIAEMGSSGSILPYEPSPYAFVLTPSPIQFTQGGTSNTVTFTLKKKGGLDLDAGTQFKLKMELYQNGSSLSSLGEGKGVKTGSQDENGISITLPAWLPAGTYQLNLKAEVNGQTYDGWQAVVVN